MNHPDDKALEQLLRADFSRHVADDGFAARVMHALPPRRRPWPWLLPLAVLAGALLTWCALAPSPFFEQAVQEWLSGGAGPASVLLLALLLGMGMLGSLWALDDAA